MPPLAIPGAGAATELTPEAEPQGLDSLGSACQCRAWARSDELREAQAGKTVPSEERPPHRIRVRGHTIEKEVVAALTLRVDAR